MKQFSWIFPNVSLEVIVRIVSKLDYNLFKEITNCLYKDYIPLLLSTMDIPVPRYYYLFWPGNSECYGVDVLTSDVDVWCRVASTNRWLLLCRWLVSDWGWVTCWCLAFAGIHPEISKTFLQSIFFVCFFPEVLQVCIGLGDFFFKRKGKRNVSFFCHHFSRGNFSFAARFKGTWDTLPPILLPHHSQSRIPWFVWYNLGGGFKYFLFSPLFGEDSHFG